MELLLEWDNALFQLINQQWASEKLDAFMRILSSKYTFIPFYIWFIVKVIKDYGRKFYLPLLMAVLAFALADSISAKVFKPGFKRLRPAFEETLNPRLPDGMPGGKYGFVSSHAANAFAIYPLLILIGLSKKKVTFKTNKNDENWVLDQYCSGSCYLLFEGVFRTSLCWRCLFWWDVRCDNRAFLMACVQSLFEAQA